MDHSPLTPPRNLWFTQQPVSGSDDESSSLPTGAPPRRIPRLSNRLHADESVDEASSGDFSFNDLMLDNGSDRPDEMPGWLQYLPPLSVVCRASESANRLETARALLFSGEDVHQKDPTYGRTPLHWACIFSDAAMLEFLLSRGASEDINQSDALGMTPLACLIKKRELPGHEAMVHCLLAAGAHLEFVEERGQELMFKDYLTPVLARTLLQKGLNLHCTNALRETPLHVASSRGHVALVEFLLSSGADPHRRCQFGGTALHDGQLAEAVAESLLRHGAQVDARDDVGQTPLMLACDFSNMPLARLLVQHGASLHATSDHGWTVMDCARKSGGPVYQFVLESAGLISGARLASS